MQDWMSTDSVVLYDSTGQRRKLKSQHNVGNSITHKEATTFLSS